MIRFRRALVACSLLLLSFGSSATAQASGTVLSRKIEFWNPDWSPDGRTLVFESNLPGAYGIYTIDANGQSLRLLTLDGSANYQPRWSSDGRRIVFSSDRAGHGDIYLMNHDGSAQTRLTHTAGGAVYQSSFSPDDRWLVFQGRPDNRETRDRIYLIASDGSGMRTLTDSSYGAEGPRWSPDGKSITFSQVAYPKRLWSEMQLADMQAARAGKRHMRVSLDGSQLTPATPDASDSDTAWNRGRTLGAYTKSVDGWAGLYLIDAATRTERRLLGGAGAGPIGYLRTASLEAGVDTFDTYTSTRGSSSRTGDGHSIVRTIRQVGSARWEISDRWFDSTSTLTATQMVRTGNGTLATERETVRALTDSASLLVSAVGITGWVVPVGQSPRLFDGPATGERFTAAVILAAIADARPEIGGTFEAPVAGLFGENPLVPIVDSLRVIAHDTLMAGTTGIPVVVVQRSNGSRHWIDAITGRQVATRGNAGPQRWWWHVRRGVQLPAAASEP